MLGTDHEPGIYARTLNDLFRAIEETSNDMEYEVSMSYLEVSLPPRRLSQGAPGTRLATCLGPSPGSFPGCSPQQLSRTRRWPRFTEMGGSAT